MLKNKRLRKIREQKFRGRTFQIPNQYPLLVYSKSLLVLSRTFTGLSLSLESVVVSSTHITQLCTTENYILGKETCLVLASTPSRKINTLTPRLALYLLTERVEIISNKTQV